VSTGFSREIPGFPTYRMDGSVTLGEHHLVIESAQLSDDAEFQCQVTPAGGDPPLVGSARLSVIGEYLGLGSASVTSQRNLHVSENMCDDCSRPEVKITVTRSHKVQLQNADEYIQRYGVQTIGNVGSQML